MKDRDEKNQREDIIHQLQTVQKLLVSSYLVHYNKRVISKQKLIVQGQFMNFPQKEGNIYLYQLIQKGQLRDLFNKQERVILKVLSSFKGQGWITLYGLYKGQGQRWVPIQQELTDQGMSLLLMYYVIHEKIGKEIKVQICRWKICSRLILNQLTLWVELIKDLILGILKGINIKKQFLIGIRLGTKPYHMDCQGKNLQNTLIVIVLDKVLNGLYLSKDALRYTNPTKILRLQVNIEQSAKNVGWVHYEIGTSLYQVFDQFSLNFKDLKSNG
ncbi:hypothetical protein TTHERM_00149370 (macronuclear) [Tetrahymena thermophila SB210]|uniref:Uncharacterized protein n=1 Tax=Tetrahymena thermophila (strain SB210) TaxID=312017 RepID=I7MGC4_TETTS|nr:hypothetical protein TTHERM_00149370 [Tetrahymena thermophila SB210]EAS01327.1 hypothetical protein TTHERM_00149370 [Tetrahymena thermophila SB210]|eukprot:XP_001021572.1 hypothetical protein TTHERM_00149370 [Tetrahymena thermophila SB210]